MRPDLKIGIRHGRHPHRWTAPEKLDRVFDTRPDLCQFAQVEGPSCHAAHGRREKQTDDDGLLRLLLKAVVQRLERSPGSSMHRDVITSAPRVPDLRQRNSRACTIRDESPFTEGVRTALATVLLDATGRGDLPAFPRTPSTTAACTPMNTVMLRSTSPRKAQAPAAPYCLDWCPLCDIATPAFS